MPIVPPLCCAEPRAAHRRDLGHLFQFDFDLYECTVCAKFSVWAWREGQGGWEPVTAADAATMLSLDEPALRTFMKRWAQEFN